MLATVHEHVCPIDCIHSCKHAICNIQMLLTLQVWMWLRPKGRGDAARMDVRRLPLSAEAACLSLGHFLQVGTVNWFLCPQSIATALALAFRYFP